MRFRPIFRKDNAMKKRILVLCFLTLILPGCTAVGLAAGAGATAGVAAAQEGGITGAVTDARIRATINDLWFRYDLETFAKLNLTVKQGRVLITGIVQKPESRVEAVRLAWQAKGVKEVINEIRIAQSSGITGFARDTWITTRLRTELTFAKDVMSINYSIDTVQGTVYLMGVARNQRELNLVTQIARTIPDVKQVVSYVRLAGEDDAAPTPASFADGPAAAPSPGQDGGAPAPLIPQPVEKERIDWN